MGKIIALIGCVFYAYCAQAQQNPIYYISNQSQQVNGSTVYYHTFTKGSFKSISPIGGSTTVPATVPNTVTTIAGNATRGVSTLTNPTPATQANFLGVAGLYIHTDKIFYSEAYSDIRKFNAQDNTLSVHAGVAGINDFIDGSAANARFRFVQGIGYNSTTGWLHVSDFSNHAIRTVNSVNVGTNVVATLAGTGTAGYTDGAGTSAQFNEPKGIVVDANGVTYVADTKNHAIRRIAVNGTVTTLAGNGTAGFVNGTTTAAQFDRPIALDINRNTGDLYVADFNNKAIRKITPAGVVTTFALVGPSPNYFNPVGVTVDLAGNAYVISNGVGFVTRISPDGSQKEIISNQTTICNSFVGSGVGQNVCFKNPSSIAFENRGMNGSNYIANLYVGDDYGIRKIEIGGYELTGTLPAGLSFDPTTGTISGTPTAITNNTSFTITATSYYGVTSTTIYIAVNDIPPAIAYNTPQTYTRGTPITALTPTNTGGAATNFSVNPSLPNGLNLNTNTGVISGTPSAIAPQTTYTITASNSGGSSNTDIALTINDIAPSNLTYGSAKIYTRNTAIANAVPTSSGGPITQYSISPALPTGITINANTGVISGTPSIISPQTNYTVTGSNSGGSTTATITIQVNDIPPSGLSYTTPNTFSRNTAITALNPTVSGGGPVISYAINPALPTGLSFNTSTGVISGTPTVFSAPSNYTISATNTGGSTSTIINIRVNDLAPTGLSYTSPNTFTRGTAINALQPTVAGGGAVTGYSITPSLPSGLTLHPTTGILSGTPTLPSAQTNYTITASNSGGSTTFTLAIAVNDIAPTQLSYPSSIQLTRNVQISPIVPSNTGGTITNYTINPSLPTGLSIHATTGVISGTPINISNTTSYTITGANAFGNTSTTIQITVVASLSAPSITYTTPNTLTLNQSITPLSPTNAGGAVIEVTSTLAGGANATGNVDGTGLAARFDYGNWATPISCDAAGNIYLNDVLNLSIRAIDPNGVVTTKATGFDYIYAMAGDRDGNIYALDNDTQFDNQNDYSSIKKISSNGTITTIGYVDNNDLYENIAVNNIGEVFLFKTNGAYKDLYKMTGYANTQFVIANIIDASIIDDGRVFIINSNNDLLVIDHNGNQLSFVKSGVDEIVQVDQAGKAIVWTGGNLFKIEANTNDLISIPNSLGYKAGLATYDLLNFYYPEQSQLKKFAPAYYQISPSLPAGLSFNNTTGVISGTPTSISGAASYTVAATNSGGTASTNISIEVIYAPIYYSKPTGNLSLPSTWNTLQNGNGIDATSLTDPTKSYILSNRNAYELNSNLTIHNLTLDAGKLLQLGNYDLTVSQLINGASANTFILTNGNGKVKKSMNTNAVFTFPIGVSVNTIPIYLPITITNNSTTSVYYATVSNGIFSNGSNSSSGTTTAFTLSPRIDMTWNLGNSSGTVSSPGINLAFGWPVNTIGASALLLNTPMLYHHNGTNWSMVSGNPMVNLANGSFIFSGYTGSFSPFSIVEASAALPLTWLSFTGTIIKSGIQLNWSTINEVNTKDFDIQYSLNGMNWASIGLVNAAGNSVQARSYEFLHRYPVYGKPNYYRIAQRDLDGKMSYSKTISVFGRHQHANLFVYPNPAHNVLNITIPIQQEIRLINLNGKVLLKKVLPAGRTELDVSMYPKGVYFIKTMNETQKCILQ